MNSKTFGNGRDVIFLHGWGGDASAFLFVANKLQQFYRVTVLDFPSFGQSPEPVRPYSVGDFADEVIALMDGLGITRAALVGHSFGGRVALEIAAGYGERVSALALIDSAGLKPRRGIKYYSRIIAHKALKRLGFGGLKGSDDYCALSPVMRETFKNVVNYNQSSLLSDITQPTAIFWGRDDSETPPYMAEAFKKHIKNSEIFWLNGGHFAYLDDSDYFFAVLAAFLRETEKQERNMHAL